MDKLIAKFSDVLTGEIDLYRSLYSTLQKERAAILGSELDQILAFSKEKDTTVLKIRIVDEQRMTLLNQLSKETQCPPEDLTLSRLSQLVGAPYSEKLKQMSTTFSALAQTIDEINQANRTLLDQSLEFVKSSIGMLGRLVSPTPIYHPSGKVENHLHSGMVFSNRV